MGKIDPITKEEKEQQGAMNHIFARMQDEAVVAALSNVIKHLQTIHDKHIETIEEYKQQIITENKTQDETK